jgi:hypothetical protein
MAANGGGLPLRSAKYWPSNAPHGLSRSRWYVSDSGFGEGAADYENAPAGSLMALARHPPKTLSGQALWAELA